VREAQELNWLSGTPAPLEYQLLNPLIWSTPLGPEPEVPWISTACISDEAGDMLDHPAFAGWFWHDPALLEAALGLGERPSPEKRQASVTGLARSKFTPEVVACYRRRLRSMARWLALASEAEMAARAWTVAEQLGTGEPADSPFVRRLIDLGLDIAFINLHRKNLL
jgi:hypothetical protein